MIFVTNLNFSEIFSIFLIILMQIFEKFPEISGPNSKVLPRPSKNGPQTFGGLPQQKNPACITVFI